MWWQGRIGSPSPSQTNNPFKPKSWAWRPRDLAVLRLMDPPADLTELPLGNSSELSVGRKVMAIGNPFGLDTTLTVGVVSALDREIQSPSNRTIRGVIQTDAAINPGNSGGPLLNSLGQLVGVNTAIYSPSGGSAGIGFAIPVNTVIEVVPQLIAFGKIMRPVLGVELASDRWLRRYRVEGVPIVRTYRGFPAETAGMVGARRGSRGEIILGDVITEIDGERVANNDEFLSAMEKHRVGDTIDIVTTREGEETLQRGVIRGPVVGSVREVLWPAGGIQRLTRQLIPAEPRQLPRVHLRLKMHKE